jgi:hypothetical protein
MHVHMIMKWADSEKIGEGHGEASSRQERACRGTKDHVPQEGIENLSPLHYAQRHGLEDISFLTL